MLQALYRRKCIDDEIRANIAFYTRDHTSGVDIMKYILTLDQLILKCDKRLDDYSKLATLKHGMRRDSYEQVEKEGAKTPWSVMLACTHLS